MPIPPDRLQRALDMLGALLDASGTPVEIAIVGGGALILHGLRVLPTEDIDVVAQRDGAWQSGSPLPPEITGFIPVLGRTYDLPLRATGSEQDWLNASAAFLMPDDLPAGFFDRTTPRTYGALTVHLPAPSDLIVLKVLAATHPARGPARRRDVQDLVSLRPRGAQLADAFRWATARRPTDHPWTERVHALLADLEAAGLHAAVSDCRGLLDTP